jgi:hypothetical protein
MTRDSSSVNICNTYPHPLFDAGWTTRGREVGSITRLDLTWLDLPCLALPSDCRRACEESNEDLWWLIVKCRESTSRRSTVPFGTHILRAICRIERTKDKGSLDKASRIDSFTSLRPWSLSDNGWWGLFRIQAQNNLPAE